MNHDSPMVREAAELLQCSADEALWGLEAACVTQEEWADDTEREGALARIRGAFEELDSGQAEGPERGVDGPFDADEHGQPITDVPPPHLPEGMEVRPPDTPFGGAEMVVPHFGPGGMTKVALNPTSPSVQPRAHVRDGDTNHPRTDQHTSQPATDRFASTSDGITCAHEWVEGTDEDGNLLEPPEDVCVQCGEIRR